MERLHNFYICILDGVKQEWRILTKIGMLTYKIYAQLCATEPYVIAEIS